MDPGEVAGEGSCELLGIAEVEALIGPDVEAADQASEEGASMPYAACRWQAPGPPADGASDAAAAGPRFVDVSVVESAERYHLRREYLLENASIDDIDDLGDDAFVVVGDGGDGSTQVTVRVGDRTVEVGVSGTDDVTADDVAGLARAVLVRI